MNVLKTGEPFPQIAGFPEGVLFEIDESMPLLIYNYSRPTAEEISDVSAAGSAFEIRAQVLSNVLWVLTKCGSQEWCDSPYNPHLSQRVELPLLDSGSMGFALSIVVVDADTNLIKGMRTIGLGNRFSMQLYDMVEELKAKPFDKAAYSREVQRAQAAYTSRQLASQCRAYFKLKQ